MKKMRPVENDPALFLAKRMNMRHNAEWVMRRFLETIDLIEALEDDAIQLKLEILQGKPLRYRP